MDEKDGGNFNRELGNIESLKRQMRDKLGRVRNGFVLNPEGINGMASGAKLLRELCYEALPEAFRAVFEVMQDVGVSPAYRLAAAQIVMERGAGKPVNVVPVPDIKPIEASSMTGAQLEQAVMLCAQTRKDLNALIDGRTIKDIVEDKSMNVCKRGG